MTVTLATYGRSESESESDGASCQCAVQWKWRAAAKQHSGRPQSAAVVGFYARRRVRVGRPGPRAAATVLRPRRVALRVISGLGPGRCHAGGRSRLSAARRTVVTQAGRRARKYLLVWGPPGRSLGNSASLPVSRMITLIWHGVVSRACAKVPALAQLKKWSLGDPLMNKLAACSTSLWFSATRTFVEPWLCCTRVFSNYSSVLRRWQKLRLSWS